MVSKQMQRIIPSATGGSKAKISQMQSEGRKVYIFTAGEPDFPTPARITEAAKKALDKGYTKYAIYSGIPELRKAIQLRLRLDHGLEYGMDQLIVTNGAKQALYCAIVSLIDPGDEVLVPTPCWVSYTEQIKMAGGVPILVPTNSENGYQLDLPAIERAISDKTRLIILNNPNNPCGCVYNRESLEAVVRLAHKRNFYIISDEIYEKLIYDDAAKFASIPALSPDAYNRTILINGCSKAYAMTGWRIGYAAGPANIICSMITALGHMTSGPNTIAQYAAVEAMSGPQDDVENMRLEFKKRSEYMYQRLSVIPGIKCGPSSGAFYLLPDVSCYFGMSWNEHVINDSADLCNYLLDVGCVATVPGQAFMAHDMIRLSYATSLEVIQGGMDQMEQALKLLRGEAP